MPQSTRLKIIYIVSFLLFFVIASATVTTILFPESKETVTFLSGVMTAILPMFAMIVNSYFDDRKTIDSKN